MGMGDRVVSREIPLSSPGAKTNKHLRAKTPPIIKQLQKQSNGTSSQFALLLVDARGETQIFATEAFQNYIDNWFPDRIRKEAGHISVTVAEEKAVRHRRQDNLEKHGQHDQIVDPLTIDLVQEEYDEDESNDDDVEDQWPDVGGYGEEPQTPRHQASSGHLKGLYPSRPTGLVPLDRAIKNKKRSLSDLQTTPGKKRKSTTKREARRGSASSDEGNDMVAAEDLEYKGLDISNEDHVITFFMTRFRQMQQLACKVVAKAWIKVIEPKKQSNFPYNRGDESKPSWWPSSARHKEPDHLMKPERLDLLLTMLRSRRVTVQKLETATAEVLTHIPKEKALLLEEIYRVAKQEERYIAGQLPPGTLCYVAASEKIVKSPNQKVPSPKHIAESVNSPISNPSISGSLGSNTMGRKMSAQSPIPQPERTPVMGSREMGSREMGMRAIPRLGTDDAVPPNSIPRPQSHNPFSSSSRTQPNVQPLNPPMSFNNGYVSQSSPIQDEQQQYLESQMPINSYYMMGQHRHSVSSGFPGPNPPHSALRRSNTMPAVPQQQSSGTVYNWSQQMPSASIVGGMYSPYSPNTQPQHSPHTTHHHGHGPTHQQSGSNPPTPVTTSSYQSMQLPPPPLPSMHTHQQTHHQQHHQQPPLGPSPTHELQRGDDDRGEQQFDTPHMQTQMQRGGGPIPQSYSEFLESPMAEVQEKADDEGRR